MQAHSTHICPQCLKDLPRDAFDNLSARRSGDRLRSNGKDYSRCRACRNNSSKISAKRADIIVLDGNIARVWVGKDIWATIDLASIPLVLDYHWTSVSHKDGRRYAIGHHDEEKEVFSVLMHRLITGASSDDMVDHRDGNGLNNLVSNLRIASHADNMKNRKRACNNKSGFKGVYWHKEKRNWAMQIISNGKRIHKRGFSTAEEAARVYDDLAREHHGEFACVNFPIDDTERAAG